MVNWWFPCPRFGEKSARNIPTWITNAIYQVPQTSQGLRWSESYVLCSIERMSSVCIFFGKSHSPRPGKVRLHTVRDSSRLIRWRRLDNQNFKIHVDLDQENSFLGAWEIFQYGLCLSHELSCSFSRLAIVVWNGMLVMNEWLEVLVYSKLDIGLPEFVLNVLPTSRHH